MAKQNDPHSVGYKRPPRECQFRPGQSGNPNGRPKGTRNFKTDLRDELSEMITFREGNRNIAVSKQRALIKRLVAAAIGGDARAINTIVALCARAFVDQDNEDQPSPEDREIVDAFAPRQAKRRDNS